MPGLFVQARIVYWEDVVLECHTVLEDRDLVDACNLIVGVLAIGDTENLGSEILNNFVHTLVFYQDAGIEVNPCGFVLGECGVGAHFQRGNEGAEWCASSRCEEHDMTSR